MNESKKRLQFLLAAASIVLISACATANDPRDELATSSVPAGLIALETQDFDQAWIEPDFDASEFTAVLIEPAEIEFDPNWGRSGQRTGSRLSIDMADFEGTREEMIAVVDQALRRTIERDEHFRIVDQPGPGVLRLRPSIDDLFITAIDPMKIAARTDQYVRNVGYGRPGLQVIDASDDRLLMQLSDQRETRRYEILRLASPGLVTLDLIDWYERFTEDALTAMP